jgi:hypothetical protein
VVGTRPTLTIVAGRVPPRRGYRDRMRRIAIAVLLSCGLAARPAAADGMPDLDGVIEMFGVLLAYSAQTVAFAVDDVARPGHGLAVGTIEVALELPGATLFAALGIDAIASHDRTGAIVDCVGATALYSWLVYDGVAAIRAHWPTPVPWWKAAIGVAGGVELTGFAAFDLLRDHDDLPALGGVQAAINLPAAGALAYLAIDEALDGHGGASAVLSTGAAASAIVGYAGIRVARDRSRGPRLTKLEKLVPGPLAIGDIGFGYRGKL